MLMLIAVMGSTFSKLVVQLDFRINRNFIASNLCENRSRPACCCHGKCFLKKQLQKEEAGDKNRSGNSNAKEKFEVSLFFENDPAGQPVLPVCPPTHYAHYQPGSSSCFIPSVFHPPGSFLLS